MSKWVDVPVTIFKTYAVEIEDSESVDDAQRYVIEDCLGDNVEIGDCAIAENENIAATIQQCADVKLSL